MVLETPSFELAKEVWVVEIKVLNQLSLEENSTSGMQELDNVVEKDEAKLELLADEIRLAIDRAERHKRVKRTRRKEK